MSTLTPKQEELCATSRWDFSDLRAMYVNCTLKRSPAPSHTQGLADRSIAIMERSGVTVDRFRAIDHEIATGVQPDMTEHGWARDDWPAMFERVIAADILVLLTPIWLGEKSSVCTQVIERLYGNSHLLNDDGQYAYYGRVGGCLVTGNEDGIKHCAMNILYSLQHLGYTIPPQADAGWIGEAGPGPELPRRRLRRPGQRLHQPQHDVHDLEPAAPGADAQGRAAASRRTATSARSGTRAAASTTPIPSTAERTPEPPLGRLGPARQATDTPGGHRVARLREDWPTMPSADPILASVLQRRVQAISREMATVLMRSSRSPIFNEIGDLVTVIFDRSGRTLAQTEYASIIANGAQPPLQRIIEYFGDDLHDGDVILHNDVFSGGNQNADVGVFLPIFFEGELVAWSASKGHVADIGGMTAGGYDPRAREVWQEAFRIPPLKIQDRGELRRDVWDLVRANIRLEIVAEDIKAMIGACTIGKRRLVDVLERYGVERFDAHMDYVIDASERQVRAELERWPDGTYHGESWMVSDGLDPTRRYRIAVAVTIAGSEITFDFSETDDQAPGFTNMPAASAIGAIRIAFLMLLAAGGLTIPGQPRPVRAGPHRVPQGLADRPALPGLDDLRQPDVRRGARGDHARARRRAARSRHRRLEPVPVHRAQRDRPADGRSRRCR